MADHIQIGDVAPRVQYAADGTQTQFTYPFPIFVAADLEVYLGEAKQASGYTIAGAGASAGGSVTFAAAPANGTVVTLRRRLAIQRTSDFQESGEFRAKVINDELDYQTAALQQVADDGARSMRLAATDAGADLVLPLKAARAGKYLAFGSDGGPVAAAGTTDATVHSAFIATLHDDADAAAARATLGFPDPVAGRYLGYDAAAAPAARRGIWGTLGYIPNRYYGENLHVANTLVAAANRLYLQAFLISERATFTRIGIEVTAAAGTNARLGIYNYDNADPASCTLLLDAGTVSTTSVALVEATIAQVLMPGWHLLAAVFDNTPTVRSNNQNVGASANSLWGQTTIGSGALIGGFYVSHTFGALPNPVGGTPTYTNNTSAQPAIWLRVV